MHHSGKDQDKGMRGSSVLKGAADTVLCCKKEGERYVAWAEKQKDGPEDFQVPFALKEVALGTDADGDEVFSCVVVQDKTGKPQPLTGHPATAVRVLRELRSSVSGSGDLAPYICEVSYTDYRTRWLSDFPEKKPDTVRKNAARALKALMEKRLVEWDEGEGPIRLLPTFHAVTTGEE